MKRRFVDDTTQITEESFNKKANKWLEYFYIFVSFILFGIILFGVWYFGRW